MVGPAVDGVEKLVVAVVVAVALEDIIDFEQVILTIETGEQAIERSMRACTCYWLTLSSANEL